MAHASGHYMVEEEGPGPPSEGENSVLGEDWLRDEQREENIEAILDNDKSHVKVPMSSNSKSVMHSYTLADSLAKQLREIHNKSIAGRIYADNFLFEFQNLIHDIPVAVKLNGTLLSETYSASSTIVIDLHRHYQISERRLLYEIHTRIKAAQYEKRFWSALSVTTRLSKKKKSLRLYDIYLGYNIAVVTNQEMMSRSANLVSLDSVNE